MLQPLQQHSMVIYLRGGSEVYLLFSHHRLAAVDQFLRCSTLLKKPLYHLLLHLTGIMKIKH